MIGAAGAELTAATAERMAAACVAYARAHRSAVNIRVYDRDGDVIHFERMDGAPMIGAAPGSPPSGSNLVSPLGSAIDPNAFDPGPGDVPVIVSGVNIGRVRIAGPGSDDHGCAEAAVAAAKSPGLASPP